MRRFEEGRRSRIEEKKRKIAPCLFDRGVVWTIFSAARK